MIFHEVFLLAIRDREVLEITMESREKWLITRMCAPIDFGPHPGFHDAQDRYLLYHLETNHPSLMLPGQIYDFRKTGEHFSPEKVVTWHPPYNWHIKRDWGMYS